MLSFTLAPISPFIDSSMHVRSDLLVHVVIYAGSEACCVVQERPGLLFKRLPSLDSRAEFSTKLYVARISLCEPVGVLSYGPPHLRPLHHDAVELGALVVFEGGLRPRWSTRCIRRH